MISWLFGRSPNRQMIERLHGEIVAASRNPILFTDYEIDDTFEGRFEALTLHAVLVLRRLNSMPPPAPEIGQDLADIMFYHFDHALRELGVGDMSVPKKMKSLAEAFLGRSSAYETALRAGRAELIAALSRNIYAGEGPSERLACYVEALDAALADLPLEVFTRGSLPFPDPSIIH